VAKFIGELVLLQRRRKAPELQIPPAGFGSLPGTSLPKSKKWTVQLMYTQNVHNELLVERVIATFIFC
jgi:hypothetical protein